MSRFRAPRLLFFLILLAAVLPFASAWFYFVVLAEHPAARPAYLIAKLVQVLLPIAAFWLLGLRSPILRTRSSGLLAGLVSGGVMATGIVALYLGGLAGSAPASAARERIAAALQVFDLSTPTAYLGFSVLLATVHALFEEVYWRWLVYGQLRTRSGPLRAAVLSSAAFAAHHYLILDRFLPGEYRWSLIVPGTLAVAAGGMVWCRLYARSGSLLGPWLSHALVDAALLWIGYQLIWP